MPRGFKSGKAKAAASREQQRRIRAAEGPEVTAGAASSSTPDGAGEPTCLSSCKMPSWGGPRGSVSFNVMDEYDADAERDAAPEMMMMLSSVRDFYERETRRTQRRR